MNPRLATLIGILIVAALFRILPHPPNVAPIAAMALFAGAYFTDRKLAFVLPFAALVISDLVIGFHSTMLFVYAAFAITVVMGFWLQSRRRALPILGAALGSSVLFFLVTNFGAWLSHGMYPLNAEGLMAAYTAGIPFFRNTLIGDLLFVVLFFGGFSLAERYIPALRERGAATA
ncbi:MAG TPA: hypothetical protein ENN42_04755 [Thioalkalivibrio sp.]|nr:hypothetical protein [Thioalkalivibrio sp.]